MRKIYYGWHFIQSDTMRTNDLNIMSRQYHEGYGSISLKENINSFLSIDSQKAVFFSYFIEDDKIIFDRFIEREELEKMMVLL